MTTRRRIVHNSLSGGVLFAVNLVIAFLLSPIIVRELGNQDYGIWDIMLSLVGYFSILEFGLSPAIVRYVALASAQGDRERSLNVFNSAILSLVGAGVVSFLVLAALSFRPEAVLNVAPGSTAHLGLLFVLMGGLLLLQFPGTVVVSYLMGYQRHYLLNGTRVVLLVVQNLFIYVALTRWPGPKLLWLGLIFFVGNLIEYGAFAVMVLALGEGLRLDPKRFSWATLRELYVFGLKSFLLMVAGRVRKQTMPLVIAHVLGVGQVVFFAIPGRLTDYALNLTGFLGSPFMPYFSALAGTGDPEAVRRAWFGLTRAMQFLLLWIPLALLALGVPFIHRWMGPSYAVQGRWVVRLLSLALLVEWIGPNSGQLLVSAGRHGRAAAVALVFAVISVAASIPLGRALGLAGIALSVAATSAVTALIFLTLACRALEVPVLEHLTRTVFRFLPALVLSGLAFLFLRMRGAPLTYPDLITHAAVAGTVYLLAAWLFALTAAERRVLEAVVARRLPWIRKSNG